MPRPLKRIAVASAMAASHPTRQWLGQPPGLVILFLTEMWEKFSYYGMRALLIYYMTKQLLIPQERASLIYGAYVAAAYFTPILGGIISDRWLGRRKAILIGGSIMAAGHFMMAFEGWFYPALATIALGNGLYLPSLPSQIGGLYAIDDPRRTSAYNVYYVGVNLGGFLAPIVCGALGEFYGWHWGFAAAGVGMLVGLLIYCFGSRWLPPESMGDPPNAANEAAANEGSARPYLLLAAVLAVVVLFRGAYEQVGNTVALWADTGVNRTIGGGWSIPMTWFQSLNALLVFVLTPVFVARWAWLARRGREDSPVSKMATGAGVVAGSYLMLAAVCAWPASRGYPVNWAWLAAFFVLLTAGELYILPIGLALFGRLAPPKLAATAMAAWFLGICGGNLLAGTLGTLWSRLSPTGFFTLMGAVAGVAGLVLSRLDAPVRNFERDSAVARAVENPGTP